MSRTSAARSCRCGAVPRCVHSHARSQTARATHATSMIHSTGRSGVRRRRAHAGRRAVPGAYARLSFESCTLQMGHKEQERAAHVRSALVQAACGAGCVHAPHDLALDALPPEAHERHALRRLARKLGHARDGSQA
jgi:hypothetical protein